MNKLKFIVHDGDKHVDVSYHESVDDCSVFKSIYDAFYAWYGEDSSHERVNWVAEDGVEGETDGPIYVEVDGRTFHASYDPHLDVESEADSLLKEFSCVIDIGCGTVFIEDPMKKMMDYGKANHDQRHKWRDMVTSRIPDGDLRQNVKGYIQTQMEIQSAKKFRESHTSVEGSIDYIKEREDISDLVKAEAVDRIQNPTTEGDKDFADELAKMEYDQAWPCYFVSAYTHIDEVPPCYIEDIQDEFSSAIEAAMDEYDLTLTDIMSNCAIHSGSSIDRNTLSGKDHALELIRDMTAFLRGECSTDQCLSPLRSAFGDRGFLTVRCMFEAEQLQTYREDEVLNDFLLDVQKEMAMSIKPTLDTSKQQTKSKYSMER